MRILLRVDVGWRALLALLLASACSRDDTAADVSDSGDPFVDAGVTRRALLDPKACRQCHAAHYQEWAGSMHAYASLDPVFLAMNRLGQKETQGALGDFCVQCHAPLAVAEGLTQDGLNLTALPEYVQGVGCYSCHNVEAIHRPNNNGLTLANDATLRGGISDPVKNGFHRSKASELHDSSNPKSATLCGACHDVMTPVGVHLERTFKEWNDSLFGAAHAPNPSGVISCNGCHMPITQGKAAETGAGLPTRDLHGHEFSAVDLALTPFPSTGNAAEDRAASERQRQLAQQMLDTSIGVETCVQRLVGGTFALYVTLENASAGHNWPSGAAQDRRAWVELRAFGADGAPLYQSGVTLEGADPDEAENDLWQFQDRMRDESGNRVHFFWQARSVESLTIPAPLSNDPSSPDFLASHVTRRFPKNPALALDGDPERVTVLVRLRPLGYELVDRLVADAELDPAVRNQIPTFDLIPNRHLANHPELSSLATVTFEWSAATLGYSGFSQRIRNDDAFPKSCVSMAPQR